MKTSPAPSTAILAGLLRVLPTVVWAPGPNAIAGPRAVPRIRVLDSRLPDESMSRTAPLRNPGNLGANEMTAVHEPPLVWLPVQVLLLRAKSRSGAFSVRTVTL